MSPRLILCRLFAVQAAREFYQETPHLGPPGEASRSPLMDGLESALQLRWLLHPRVGLPRDPFLVWRRPKDPQLVAAEDYAALDDWELVEIVGLPAEGQEWLNAGYSATEQGLLEMPLLSPREAAWDRLLAGAPGQGWRASNDRGVAMPAWEPTNPDGLLDLLARELLPDLANMLAQEPDPLRHESYRPIRLVRPPRQIAYERLAPGAPQQATWNASPLQLLLWSAGSDPFASLALGFGTVIPYLEDHAYMVTVQHRLNLSRLLEGIPLLDLGEMELELAFVILDAPQAGSPAAPSALRTATQARNRPTRTNGPWTDAVDVLWGRPPEWPVGQPLAPRAASYAIARTGPDGGPEILLARRPEEVGGWAPFVPGTAGDRGPEVRFTEPRLGAHRRETPLTCTYSVAAQDIFGYTSPWASADYGLEPDPVQTPRVAAVRLEPLPVHGPADPVEADVSVDFAWDWSDRSPIFVEVSLRDATPPGAEVLNAKAFFLGNDNVQHLSSGTPGVMVEALNAERRQVVAWGPAQDAAPADGAGTEPETRYYRLTARLTLNFAGRRELALEARARGRQTLFPGPANGVSSWSQPVIGRVHDPRPPEAPQPEAPQWASLPDATGVSRALLTWRAEPGLSYMVYEASETRILQADDRPGPDLAQPFSERLTTLKSPGLALPARQDVFGRALPQPVRGGSVEIALPRGSQVIHVYTVRAINANQVESAWPQDIDQYLFIAAPRLAVPVQPILEATLSPAHENPEHPAGATAHLAVRVRSSALPGGSIDRVELYRTTNQDLAQDVDTMGPPVATLHPNGVAAGVEEYEMSHQEPVTPGWWPFTYRAVAWSANSELAGLRASRSTPSPAVSLFVPPAGPPDLSDLRGNEPGSTPDEALISWRSATPIRPTPLGPHTMILVVARAAADGEDGLRLEARLHDLTVLARREDLPGPNPADRRIFRIGANPARYYAWVGRPVAGEPFTVTVKLVDPLGRLARLEATVPVEAALPPPALSSIGANVVHIPFLPGPLVGLNWQVLSPIAPDNRAGYRLVLEARRPGMLPPQPLARLDMSLADAPIVASPGQVQQVLAQAGAMAGLVQVGNPAGPPYRFVGWLRHRPPLQITVGLQDPQGQTTQEEVVMP